MISVKFIEHDGTEHEVEGKDQQSLMKAAVTNNVPGILADCGGSCACATCHVVVSEEWWDKLPALESEEDMMLDIGVEERTERSRLSCQIKLSEELQGLTVHTPESQI